MTYTQDCILSTDLMKEIMEHGLEITLPKNTHLASEFSFDNKELKLLQKYLG